MNKAGIIAVWVGLTLAILGLISGFSLLFFDYDDIAMMFMAAVPFGFLVLFAGLVATQLRQAR